MEQFDTSALRKVDSQVLDTGIRGDLLEVKARFSLAGATAERFGFMLRVGEVPFERTLVGYDRMAKRAFLDRTLSGEAVTGVRSIDIDTANNSVDIHLFLDRSSVEVFLNEGEQVITSRIYPSESSLDFKLFAENGVVELEALDVWQLKDIWK
ncbi:sucrose-6-phosphate hydrolase [Vibrio maritimus]|uniref:Sucrose-6-phosphate hydrolase n=1 Tax=Vibrio maritimus TaxID=990268 RepID=A0A090TXP0_9VIBR|nr:sucrose-6-phosphate hydrolase [Vibrio maritimus]